MDTLDSEVLDAAGRWAQADQRFALFTVVRTWGSSPRPPGAWMALRHDGVVHGSVSGGCIEEDLIARIQAGEFRSGNPFTLRYGVKAEEAWRFGLPCGGTLELLVEPEPDTRLLAQLSAHIKSGHLVQRQVSVGNPEVQLNLLQSHEGFQWDGEILRTPHGPDWRLLLIGAGQISRFIAPIALALGYQVLVCDPRVEYTEEWDIPGTQLIAGMPDDAVLEIKPDPHCAIVALTHDPKLDDMALLEALKSKAFYVGALGSVANNTKRKARLKEHFDLTYDELSRLHGPVGLSIGSRTPPEIAVSIMAEMTAVKNTLMK
jgi:xanthine dehydrogenase accessory factor